MSDDAFLHEASDTVRFWVLVNGQAFGASVGRSAQAQGEDPLETLRQNLPAIEAAVRRRIAQGAREPVMLRGIDPRVRGAQERG